jgi:phosphomannomutase
LYDLIGPDLVAAYVDRIASSLPPAAPRELRWVYTPLHGVGGSLVERVVEACGFPAAQIVREQAEPDPRFPTVAFPNPEEPGAIDLAIAQAQQSDAARSILVAIRAEMSEELSL